MSKQMLAVRIPENMHKYLKHKAIENGSNLTKVVTNIVSDFQQNDKEFLAQFPQYQPQASDNKEVAHGV